MFAGHKLGYKHPPVGWIVLIMSIHRPASRSLSAGVCLSSAASVNEIYKAPVAQLDRVLPSEGRGHRFESYRARHFTIAHGKIECLMGRHKCRVSAFPHFSRVIHPDIGVGQKSIS